MIEWPTRYIYIFGSDAIPGIYKVGTTIRPKTRREELCRQYKISFELLSLSPIGSKHTSHIEVWAHYELFDDRFSGSINGIPAGREFFCCSFDGALSAINIAIAKYDDYKCALANLQLVKGRSEHIALSRRIAMQFPTSAAQFKVSRAKAAQS